MDAIRFSYDSPGQWGIPIAKNRLLSGGDSPRRKLLAHSLRVTSNLFPEIAAKIDAAARKLALPSSPVAFIANDPVANAICIPWSSDGEDNFAVMLTSGLVKLLTASELQFVIGHEIGHFVFRHFTYPSVGEETNLGERLASLNLQRAAEISADRMGLLAARSVEEGCSAMMKTACGLGAPYLRLHVPTILAQFRELTEDAGGHRGAVFDTHPMMAIRIRSMLRFSTTDAFHELRENPNAIPSTIPGRVDEAIRHDFDRASGFTHESWENESLAQIRLWAVLLLFVSDHRLSKEEQHILRECFGEEHARNAISFVRSSGKRSPEVVLEKFQEACGEASAVGREKLDQLFSEMERIASAASGDNEAILGSLQSIADSLKIDRSPQIAPWEPDIE